jgi:hypothetical protein
LKGRVDNRSSSLGKTTLQIQDLVENHRIPPKYYYVIKILDNFSKNPKAQKPKGTLMVEKGLVKAIPVAKREQLLFI